ncbi:MAG: glycine zipper 2TM domain-containing protein [Pseudomonadales bacterium]
MKTFLSIALAFSLIGVTAGCAQRDEESYSRYETNQSMNVEYGTVREMRRVNLRGYSNGVGAVTGAVIGGVAGNAVSGRWDKGLGTMIGILVGGLVGSATQQGMTATDGCELIIQLDSGRTVAIAVPINEQQFGVGQRVKLMENSRGSRVVPTNEGYSYPPYDSYRN